MQRPTFTATAVMSARRNPEKNAMELNLIDANGNTQNLVLDNVAAGHVLAAMLQKSTGTNNLPEVYLNEAIPLFGVATFTLPEHAGLRMFINPTSVIDFSFERSFAAQIKSAVDKLAQPASA